MNNKIDINHTLEEYNKKYSNRKCRLLKFSKKEVEEFDRENDSNIKGFLLNGRKWWLIDDTYYEIPRAFRYTWFRNLNGAIQIGCCVLGAGVIASAITAPLVLLNRSEESSVTVTGATIDKTNSFISLNKDSTVAFTYADNKDFVRINFVKVGDKEISSDLYTLIDGNAQSKKVVIKAKAMTSIKIDISVELKDKTPTVIKVNSVEISNTKLEVETDEEIELTATVLPENASNKELDWTITAGSDKAEIRKDEAKNKFYLKGKNEGDLTVTATAKDGSGKTDSKTFKVIESSYLEYSQVGKSETCLVKAKTGKTLPENVVIPEKDPSTNRTVIGIAINGFGKDLNVKTITFAKPDNITTISPYAFKDNNSLVSFEIPKNVEEIGDGAFSFNPGQAGKIRSLTTITFESENKLKKIGNSAFLNQWEIKSIEIPSSVEFIGKDAFYATGLTSAKFDDTTSNWLFKGGNGNNEIWMPTTDVSANAVKLKSDPGYFGIVKNTITISGESSVVEGETIKLSVPDGITVNEWKSSDTSKATVNDGVVTGVAAGDCYIYVTAEDGSKAGIKKISVIESIKSFNIAWTNDVEFSGGIGTISPYNLAKQSTELIIGTNEEYGSIVASLPNANVGESTDDIIKAYYDKTTGSEKLYILSDKKISFADNDRPNYVSKEEPGSGYFASLTNLNSIVLNNIDTAKTTNMHGLFYNTEKISSLDLTTFDTSNVENMAFMFTDCAKLANINLSSFDTKKVKTMEAMFLHDTLLTVLDISSFTNDVLENTESMFAMQSGAGENESKLKTIYANDKFDISKTKGDNTFDNCVKLKGGSKFYTTSYDGNKISSKYGKFDCGTHTSESGYFTDKRYVEETDLKYFDFELIKARVGETYYYSVKAKDNVTLPEIVVLPNTYEGTEVRDIKESGFSDRTELKGIVLNNKMAVINNYAFKGCTNLEHINALYRFPKIGEESFANTKITHFRFELNEELSVNAFDNCKYLTYFIIDSQLLANIGKDEPSLDINNTIYKNIQEIRISSALDIEDESIINRFFNYKSSLDGYDYYIRKK